MSWRQQNVARQIVLKMEGKGPYGITTDKVDGHGVLRKVLLMLWELPMAAGSEYDGIGLLRGTDASALSSLPPEVDKVLLYHLCGKGQITEGQFKHTSVAGKAVMLDLQRKHGVARSGSNPEGSPAAHSQPTVALSGASDFLCVYRLATS